MPATYAHYQFGRECIKTLPTNLQEKIHTHRDIYNFAVQGPDILFYDLLHTNITSHGYDLHKQPARDFFERIKPLYLRYKEKDEMLVYMLGFLTHFALDSTCHGYVEKKAKIGDASHNKIESCWDKHCIKKDKRVFYLVDRAESLKPTEENTKIISYFYTFSPDKIYRACKWQKSVLTFMNCINVKRYNFLTKLVTKLGFNKYADLLMQFDEFEPCKDSNLRLDKIKAKAFDIYPKLVNSLLDFLKGKKELSKYFDNDFAGNEEGVEVLPYKKELKYQVK